jgi:uncharacterized protein (DUF362 family)
MTMNRRDFLKAQLHGSLWLSAGAAGLIRPTTVLAAPVPDLAVVKSAPGPATRAAVELLGGMGAFVKAGARVVVKPNMSFTSPPEAATNTHPHVVREIVAMCKEAGASSVLVLDHTLGPPRLCLERSGIEDAVGTIDKDIVFSINDGDLYRDTPIAGGKRMARTEIPAEVLRADVLIAVPVAKSHSSAGVSLSMKGMMGLVHDRWVMHRRGLDACIVDVCTVLKADLAVIDASRVLTTGGPRGPGKVIAEHTVIASSDMVAADAHAVNSFEWYGKRFKARQVGHIREAHARGLGRMDVENLAIESLTL